MLLTVKLVLGPEGVILVSYNLTNIPLSRPCALSLAPMYSIMPIIIPRPYLAISLLVFELLLGGLPMVAGQCFKMSSVSFY
jgi:hypothetical protein